MDISWIFAFLGLLSCLGGEAAWRVQKLLPQGSLSLSSLPFNLFDSVAICGEGPGFPGLGHSLLWRVSAS